MNQLIRIFRFLGAWFASTFALLLLFAIILPADENGQVNVPEICLLFLFVVPIVIGVFTLKKSPKIAQKAESATSPNYHFVENFLNLIKTTKTGNHISQKRAEQKAAGLGNSRLPDCLQRRPEARASELNTTEKYREHRIALQNYKAKLDAREAELNKKEQEIKALNSEKINAVKRMEAELIAKIKSDKDMLLEYENALHKTECTIIDWLKRVDKKETAAFEEIRQGVNTFQKYNSSTASEDGFQFEENFAAILTLNGFNNVQVTQRSNDFGADIIAEKNDIKYAIQCKYYTSAVGVEAVQQVFAAKIHYSAHVAVVATNSVFTKAAQVLAKESGVLLWDCEKIHQMTEKTNV